MFTDNRPYHFQAEDEADQKAWVAVLINCKEKALTKTFQHTTNPQISPSLIELQKTLIKYVWHLRHLSLIIIYTLCLRHIY